MTLRKNLSILQFLHSALEFFKHLEAYYNLLRIRFYLI